MKTLDDAVALLKKHEIFFSISTDSNDIIILAGHGFNLHVMWREGSGFTARGRAFLGGHGVPSKEYSAPFPSAVVVIRPPKQK